MIKKKNLKLNEDETEESQRIILNSLIDQAMYTPENDYTIFDRSVLDNLIYTLWLNAHEKVSDSFVKETIKLVRESLIFYDVLFFLPITKQSPIPFEEAPNRSISAQYREEIDNLFKSIIQQYYCNNRVYFPFNDKKGCPAIIEIFGNREERIQLTKYYIQEDGNPYSEHDSLILPSDPQLSDFK